METTTKTRVEKMKEFYNTLKTEIDLQYFADEAHETFEDLREAVEDGQGFDVEIIYYSRAMEYLTEHDNSLRESLGLAADMGSTPLSEWYMSIGRKPGLRMCTCGEANRVHLATCNQSKRTT